MQVFMFKKSCVAVWGSLSSHSPTNSTFADNSAIYQEYT